LSVSRVSEGSIANIPATGATRGPDDTASGVAFNRADAPDAAIDIVGLTKRYRTDRPPALDAVDLTVPRGTIFGLLGPNGAGKSTLINILGGLVLKTAGQVSVWGHDLDAAPRHVAAAIGIVPQELNIDNFFTPREALEFQAGLFGVPRRRRRTDEILAAVRLTEQADAYARSLSGGMRRRLMVAKAMVHAPPVLVLDEPTAGVDVELREQLWAHIRGLNAAGVTVVLTTHYLEEAQALCQRIAIIHRGRLVACDDTDRLVARLDAKELRLTLAHDLAALPPALAAYAPERHGPRELVLRYRPSRQSIGEILAAVQAAGLQIADLSTREGDLEDVFRSLTS
jgi:ABC-2 type transport system ATP-binding protein